MKKTLLSLAMIFMLITPVLTIPKLPTIPNISASVTLPEETEEAVEKAAIESVKKLNIDWSKFDFGFIFNK